MTSTNSNNLVEIQHHEPAKNKSVLPFDGQDDGAAARPSTSPIEDLQPENSHKRKRNGPATMPGFPTSYSAPPRPFDPNTQIKNTIGGFDKYERWMTFKSLQEMTEPGQGPIKRRCKNHDVPAARDRSPKAPSCGHAPAQESAVPESVATTENAPPVALTDEEFEDNLAAELRKYLKPDDGDDAVDQTLDEQSPSSLRDDAVSSTEPIDEQEAEFYGPAEESPAVADFDDVELILEDPEEVARKYWEGEARHKEAEAEQAATFEEYLKAAAAQQEADRLMEDDEESEDDEEVEHE
jgi:hypothetical protein